MAYSIDFSRKILEIKEDEKLSLDDCSKRFKVGRVTIFRWTKRIEPKLTRNKPATKINMEKLKEDIEKYSDAYLSERAKRLGVCVSCVWYAIKRLSITYKKTLQHPKRDAEKRSIFKSIIRHSKKIKRSLVYIDESGFSVDSPRTHGYSQKGKRCYGKHDWQAKGRINSIGALLNRKLLVYKLYEKAINANIFMDWITSKLLPKAPNNSVFILDNASFHKRKDIKDAVISAGHTLLFQPTYSPDLNEIENKWAHLKSKRKKENIDVYTLFKYHAYI